MNSLPGPVIWPDEKLIIPGISPPRESEASTLPELEPSSPIPLVSVIKYPLLTLSSGQTLKVERVTLYDEEQVREIAALRARAMKNLGGFSSGIGFLGSPEWALGGGAATLGLIEGLISGAMRNQGIELLRNVQRKAADLLKNGKLFDVANVENSGVPDPQVWSFTDRGQWDTKRFVHSGSEFVSIEAAEVGLTQIRWSSVVAYSPPQMEKITP